VSDPSARPNRISLSSHVRLPRLGQYPHANIGFGAILAFGLAGLVALLTARSRWGFRLKVLGSQPRRGAPRGHQRRARRRYRDRDLRCVRGARGRGDAPPAPRTASLPRSRTTSDGRGCSSRSSRATTREPQSRPRCSSAALEAGGSFLSTTGIPTDLVPIVQALIVLGVVLPPALPGLRARFRTAAMSTA